MGKLFSVFPVVCFKEVLVISEGNKWALRIQYLFLVITLKSSNGDGARDFARHEIKLEKSVVNLTFPQPLLETCKYSKIFEFLKILTKQCVAITWARENHSEWNFKAIDNANFQMPFESVLNYFTWQGNYLQVRRKLILLLRTLSQCTSCRDPFT